MTILSRSQTGPDVLGGLTRTPSGTGRPKSADAADFQARRASAARASSATGRSTGDVVAEPVQGIFIEWSAGEAWSTDSPESAKTGKAGWIRFHPTSDPRASVDRCLRTAAGTAGRSAQNRRMSSMACLQHRDPLRAHAEREAADLRRVVAAVAQHRRVDHARAHDLQPAGALRQPVARSGRPSASRCPPRSTAR